MENVYRTSATAALMQTQIHALQQFQLWLYSAGADDATSRVCRLTIVTQIPLVVRQTLTGAQGTCSGLCALPSFWVPPLLTASSLPTLSSRGPLSHPFRLGPEGLYGCTLTAARQTPAQQGLCIVKFHATELQPKDALWGWREALESFLRGCP